MKFFKITVSPNRNYATLESNKEFIDLPHSFSSFEVELLENFIAECCPSVSFVLQDSGSKSISVKNVSYSLRTKPLHYLDTKLVEEQSSDLEYIEQRVADQITFICTPKF